MGNEGMRKRERPREAETSRGRPTFPHSLIPSFPHSLIPSFPHSLIPSFPAALPVRLPIILFGAHRVNKPASSESRMRQTLSMLAIVLLGATTGARATGAGVGAPTAPSDPAAPDPGSGAERCAELATRARNAWPDSSTVITSATLR